ncbi:hypothetical protein [Mesorhizobium sp. WSM2239]|uniref:ATP-binding protein n=2 Tax=unclassified Mesorhizobium TaxID=325217 RepID=A0AAU8DH09_9HYPH
MKLNSALAYDHSSAGFGEARQFGFEMNAMAFHAVIDGIYSDKILAPVREYSTNAYDAHLMADKEDEPFVLMAPSTFHPYFMVRDFGPGMIHEEVMDRATTMFASNKRDTNKQVGMLGLGMKSAFAYTKQYTITCYDGVEQRDYVCYLDAGGSPTVTALDPVPSTEPRGVKVSFPVQQGDIEKFKIAISKVMIGFDPMPNILNEQWRPSVPTATFQGSNFRLVKSNHIASPHIRQGCVLYPLDLNQLGIDNWNDRQLPIIIDVPIGTASVSTSREQLGYDELTKKNLASIFQAARQEIVDTLQQKLDEPDSYHDACTLFEQLRSVLPWSLFPKDTKWRDKRELRTAFSWSGGTGSKIRVNPLFANDDLSWTSAKNKDAVISPKGVKSMVIAWESWSCTFGKERLRMYRHHNPDQNVLWVKEEHVGSAMRYYGIDTVIDLRDYERMKLPRAVREKRSFGKMDVRRFNRWRDVVTDYDLDQKTIYVLSEAHMYLVCGQTLAFETVWEKFIKPATNAGLIDAPMIVLLKNQRKLPEGKENWVSLDDILKSMVKDFDPVDYRNRKERNSLFHDGMFSALLPHKDKLPKLLKNFFDSAVAEPLTYGEGDLAKLWKEVTGKELLPLRPQLIDRFRKLTGRYPLLQLVRNNEAYLDHYLKLIAR